MALEPRRRRAARWLLAAGLLGGTAALAEPAPATLAACIACHGAGGNSELPTTPSLAGQPKVFIENQLVLIREGLRDIPTMKESVAGLSDTQIVALATHFAALPLRPRPAAAEPARLARGAATSRRMLCGTCHLPSYLGQAQVPRLAGQNEAYLLQAMKQFRDRPGPGRDTIMAASLYGLGDGELADLAHYLAHSAGLPGATARP